MSDNNNRHEHAQVNAIDPQAITDASIAVLARAIYSTAPEPISCAESRDLLAELYTARQAMETLSPELEMVAAHLDTCPECTVEYETLVTLMTTFQVGLLPQVDDSATTASPPASFDLSFLHNASPATPPQAVWSESVVNGARSILQEVQILLQATGATFATLRDYLQPAATPSLVLRSDTNNKAEILMLPAPDADFSVHLSVGPIVAGFAAVILKFLDLTAAKPLANLQVTLRNGQRQLLVGAMTGQDGNALFEQLAPGRYLIQVRHKQQLWEIPLVLIADCGDAHNE